MAWVRTFGSGILHKRFEHGVADAHIVGDIGLKALKRLEADGDIFVVSQGDHECVADRAVVALVTGAAFIGQQAEGVVVYSGIQSVLRADEQQLANLRVVERAVDGFGLKPVVGDLNILGVGLAG